MGEWRETTFGRLGEIYDGPHATPTRRDEGPFFLNISSLQSGRLNLAESDHVSVDDFQKWTRRVTPEAGDLLFSYETRLGDAALMPGGVKACLGRRMALLRPDRAVVDPRFLLYLYLGPYFQRTVEQNTIHGATVERISLKTMGSWPVRLPQLDEQRAIADVLGALDDKIAANTRLAATADDLACTEFAKVVHDVAPGPRAFTDVATIGGGGTPRSTVPEFWDGDVRWLTPTDVTGLAAPYVSETKRHITDSGLEKISSPRYPVGSIFMTSRATIGAFAIAERPMAVNQGFIVIVPIDPEHRYWLFHEMRSRVPEFLDHANGATFMELSRGNFKKMPVRMAEESVIREFNSHAKVLHDRASAAIRENACLTSMRDTLLPQLMSGKLRVREAAEVAGL